MTIILDSLQLEIKKNTTEYLIDGVTYGFETFAISKILKQLDSKKNIIYISQDDSKLHEFASILSFINPDLSVLQFPAWDCLPYDRVSPSVNIVAQRLETLSHLLFAKESSAPFVLLTSVNAIIQKTLPRKFLEKQSLQIKTGQKIIFENLLRYLEDNGFERTSLVQDKGEYAVRGGILDIFLPNEENPSRLDFFGEEVEKIRSFSAQSQKTIKEKNELILLPMSEITLNEETIRNFRQNYLQRFGVPKSKDSLYNTISQGRRFSGMEHWLPLFYENSESLFDYCQGSLVFDYLTNEAFKEREELIFDYFNERKNQNFKEQEFSPYQAIAPETLYLSMDQIEKISKNFEFTFHFSPFYEENKKISTIHTNLRKGKSFLYARQKQEINLFEEVVSYLQDLKKQKKKILIAGWSEGSLTRLLTVLREHNLKDIEILKSLSQFDNFSEKFIFAAVLPIENGFENDNFSLLTEQDILGDRLISTQKKKKKRKNALINENSLEIDDLVVHIDHGIGRFAGLKTLKLLNADHDCLEIHYAEGGKLYLPIENIELLSRYSGPQENAILDKIGGVAWQNRKAKLKKRLLELADHFIQIAAKRQIKKAPIMEPPCGMYDEFVATFPYEETSDQLQAIDDVLSDLASGKPMDRLICGDVGFGKTEVALRAAFVAALNGYQTALVVPTTLLSRQHTQTFLKRFQKFPINIAQLSRFTSSKEKKKVEEGLRDGNIDIVIGTHTLLNKNLIIKNLGLFIIDEEQHFGVKHKERLKELKESIHVLTLSATPIPRTLQLALTGVRELSLIASAPIDRLAVRTLISPFDKLTIRETLLREYYRGGQSFYVCPRVSDLAFIYEFLEKEVPELKIAVAHGQLPTKDLDQIMNAFYDKEYHVLLATTIIESGLDIPSANTMIVHRADMFGLAALYQLRGRIGRSKQRAYALLTTTPGKLLTKIAEKRLKILQSLDELGLGFQLASHDMDLRGSGNLLGEEQSGHIKEVGFGLYQQMLEDAVSKLQNNAPNEDHEWSPQINIGISVLIPESYILDLQLRLKLYRQLSILETIQEINTFGSELIDRFGKFPDEVEHLLKIICIKTLCKKANINKIDAGEKGIVISFRNNFFSNPSGLIDYMAKQGNLGKIRADQTLLFIRSWRDTEKKINGIAAIVNQIFNLIQEH